MAGKGKKGRKIGRNLRKPSKKRYASEHRWIANKARRAAKFARKHNGGELQSGLDPDIAKLARKILRGHDD